MEGLVSPLTALIWHLNNLVNPASQVNSMEVGFRSVVGGKVVDTTVDTLRQISNQQGTASTSSSSTSSTSSSTSEGNSKQLQQQQTVVSMPFNVVKVDVLMEHQVKELALYLTQDEPLRWPKPSFRPGFKTQLALLAHARLFDTPLAGRGSISSSSSKEWYNSSSSSGAGSMLGALPEGAVATQRPKLEGRYEEKVRV